MDIIQLLSFGVKNKASDLHLASGSPPMIRVDGEIRRINLPKLESELIHRLVYDVMDDNQRKFFEEFLEIDFSFEVPSLARFRVNVFNQYIPRRFNFWVKSNSFFILNVMFL